MTSANIYFPLLDEEGRPKVLRAHLWVEGELSSWGRGLWLGSHAASEQRRLCALMGGHLPSVDGDGFRGWADGPGDLPWGPESERIQALAERDEFSGVGAQKLAEWVDSLWSGGKDPEAVEAFERVPLERRMGGRLELGSASSELLSPAELNGCEIFGLGSASSGVAALPILVEEQSAALLATLSAPEEKGQAARVVEFHPAYLFERGRWLVALRAPSEQASAGPRREACWVPLGQALALSESFDPLAQSFVAMHASEADLRDLSAIAEALPSRFFPRDPAGLAWWEGKQLGEAAPATASRKAGPRI